MPTSSSTPANSSLPQSNNSSKKLAELLAYQQAVYRRTILENPFIPQVPTQKQSRFLAYLGREALYGGAAGGAKTSALLMAALQYVEVPGYAALLIRRTFRHLNQDDGLIPRSKAWLQGKAVWNQTEKRWTFPSGATLSFGYLDEERHLDNYQGGAWQFIGVDELTQLPEQWYTYLFSRLRKPDSFALPLRMRGASNPGGVGAEWVKRRFVVAGATRFFVPAKLDDNPYLDREAYVKSLAELDPITRAQLLAGNWDVYAGGRFQREWIKFYKRRYGEYVFGEKSYVAELIRDRFITADFAATVKSTAKPDPDWTVISSWGMTPCGLLVWLGCRRIRCEVPDIAPALAAEYGKHGAGKAYCESGGMQNGVVQLAKRHKLPNGRFMNVLDWPVSGKGDKLQRAAHILNMAQAGRLWLPEDDPSFPLAEVHGELLRFTGDPKQDGHDDVVDTASVAGAVASGKQPTPRIMKGGGTLRPGLNLGVSFGFR